MLKVYRPGFVSAIGWFPFVARWRHLRNTSYATYARRSTNPKTMQLLIAGLFKTGNQKPPAHIFVHKDAFLSYLRKREYRGALSLHDIEIEDHGRRIRFVCNHLQKVGYTPFPLLWEWYWVRRFLPAWRGEGEEGVSDSPSYTVDQRQKVIVINFKVKFRIGRRFRQAIQWLAGSEPPYVWMHVECCFDLKSATGKVRAVGTSVPSQWFRWATPSEGVLPVATSDMIFVNLAAIRSVFECTSDTAPRYSRFPWVEASIL